MLYLCIWYFCRAAQSKKKEQTPVRLVFSACSGLLLFLWSNLIKEKRRRINNDTVKPRHPLWFACTTTEENNDYTSRTQPRWLYAANKQITELCCSESVLPWAWDICQWPMFTLWSPRIFRGKEVTSPAPKTSGMLVLMNWKDKQLSC